MLVQRTENKYIVPATVYKPLLCDITKFAKYDQYCEPNLYYKVYSTYFDTYDFSYYKKRIEKKKSGYRIRIRSYELPSFANASLKVNHKFEIKSKMNQSYKDSFFISPQLFDKLSQNSPYNHILLGEKFEDLHVMEIINYLGVRPVCNIEYMRKAFFTNESKTIRITLDSSILCSDLVRFQKFNLVNTLTSIFEIKNFSQAHYPVWLIAILNKYNLESTSFSKYKKSVEILNSSILHYGN